MITDPSTRYFNEHEEKRAAKLRANLAGIEKGLVRIGTELEKLNEILANMNAPIAYCVVGEDDAIASSSEEIGDTYGPDIVLL